MDDFNKAFKMAYSKPMWAKYHIKAEVSLSPYQNPSILIAGDSGTGKSTSLKYMLHSLLLAFPSTDLWMLNYKDSLDYRFLKSYSHYYFVNDCKNGFEQFYSHFCEIKETIGESIDHLTILVFDEYVAFYLNTLMSDKKGAERYSRMLGEILMTGRSYKVGAWVTNQRSDAAYYSGGAREQFMVKLLMLRGKPSKESLTMLGFSKEDVSEDYYTIGDAIADIDGSGKIELKFPAYNHKKIEHEILDILSSRARAAEGGTGTTGQAFT